MSHQQDQQLPSGYQRPQTLPQPPSQQQQSLQAPSQQQQIPVQTQQRDQQAIQQSRYALQNQHREGPPYHQMAYDYTYDRHLYQRQPIFDDAPAQRHDAYPPAGFYERPYYGNRNVAQPYLLPGKAPLFERPVLPTRQEYYDNRPQEFRQQFDPYYDQQYVTRAPRQQQQTPQESRFVPFDNRPPLNDRRYEAFQRSPYDQPYRNSQAIPYTRYDQYGQDSYTRSDPYARVDPYSRIDPYSRVGPQSRYEPYQDQQYNGYGQRPLSTPYPNQVESVILNEHPRSNLNQQDQQANQQRR